MDYKLDVQIVGMIGDATTFVGAFLLATREAGEGKRTQEILTTAAALKEFPRLSKLGIEIEGIVIRKESDIEIAVVSKSDRRARWGAIVIAIGFVFLFASRLMEILGP